MPSFADFNLDTTPFTRFTRDANRTVDKTTKYALRATGRYLSRVARSSAPTYPGSKNKHPEKVDQRALAEAGSLKKSIKNARTITQLGTGDFALKVGPFGTAKKGTAVHYARTDSQGRGSGGVRGVQLYRGRVEAMYGFMRAGVSAADGDKARQIYESAYAKAFAKYH